MAIWKLAPILTSASDDAWVFSRWYGQVLVRAKNPGQARQIAAQTFWKTHAGETGAENKLLASPWLNEGMVACLRVAVSTYIPDGPDQILRPHLTEYRWA